MSVVAGEVQANEPFTVHPLNVTIEQFTTEPRIGSTTLINVQVTDLHGDPVPDVDLELSSTYGMISEDSLITDSVGRVSANLVSPRNPGSAQLTARVGFAGFAQQDYEVVVPPGQAHPMDAKRALVVGDKTTAGYLTYNRYDGTDIEMDYPVAANIDLQGDANGSIALTLGDLSDPNLAPVAAYFMSQLDEDELGNIFAPDATGLHNAVADQIEVEADHPLGAGHSFHFQGTAALRTTGLSALAQPDNVGFRIDVKPDSAAGSIFDFHQGAWRLEHTAGGVLRFQVVTDTGSYAVESSAVTPNIWHTVAGRYQGGVLELEVDGVHYETTGVTGNLSYNGSPSLVVGGNFEGLLNSLRFYDWRYQPLLAFSNTTAQMTVSLDAGGTGIAEVQSLGHMNDQQTGSLLPLLRVAVSGGGDRQYVSLLSSDMYIEVGSHYVDHIHPSPPPLAMGGIGDEPSLWISAGDALLSAMVKPAHAATVGDVAGWIWEGVNWIIPLEDIGTLGKQLWYLSTNDPRFDAVELSLATLGTISIIPIAKPFLRPVVTPLKRMVRFANTVNPKFVRSFGSVIGATRGEFVSVQTQLVDGQATAQLAAASRPGSGFVSVSVGNKVEEIEVSHEGTGQTVAGFEHAAVVGAASDGSVMIDGLNGPTSHNYITSTEAILQGTPGEQITLAPGGFFTPNALPVMHLAMNGIDTIGGRCWL